MTNKTDGNQIAAVGAKSHDSGLHRPDGITGAGQRKKKA